MKRIIFFILIFFILSLPVSILAVEVAPRISDREIIEKLAVLEAGQEALRSEMKYGQESLGKRMDDMNATMLTLFSTMVALILALFAYIAWDRRTMLKPVVGRLDSLERDVIKDLNSRHTESSLLSKQLKALREYAQDDPKLTEILRGLSLF